MSQVSTTYDIRKRVIQLLELNDTEGLAQLMEDLPSREIVHLIGHLNHSDQMQLFTFLNFSTSLRKVYAE